VIFADYYKLIITHQLSIILPSCCAEFGKVEKHDKARNTSIKRGRLPGKLIKRPENFKFYHTHVQIFKTHKESSKNSHGEKT